MGCMYLGSYDHHFYTAQKIFVKLHLLYDKSLIENNYTKSKGKTM